MFIQNISKCVVLALSLGTAVDGLGVPNAIREEGHGHDIPKKLPLKRRACSRKPATTITTTKVFVSTTSNILISQATSAANKGAMASSVTTSASVAANSPVVAVSGGYMNAVYFVNWYVVEDEVEF